MTKLDPHDGRSWDKYSAQWGELEEAGLGVEWGTEELTQRIFDNCLRPHLAAQSHVLEIGPGGGKYSVLSAPLCARLVLADVSTQMLGRAGRALAGHENVELLKLGGVDLAGVTDESIDFAFSIDVFVHLDLEDVYGYVRELHRVLRPGGKLVLHFANLGSRAGWARFHRIADYNRAMRRQVGRINFVTPDIIVRVLSEARFTGIDVDTTSTSPRDFVVSAEKGLLPEDPDGADRTARILARTAGSSVGLDLVQRAAYAVEAPSDDSLISVKRFEHAGEWRSVIFAQPEARLGFALSVPSNATLCTGIALHPDGQVGAAHCAVSFQVQVVDSGGITPLLSRVLDPDIETDRDGWTDVAIDLQAFAGEVVFLVLETSVPEGVEFANGACWGEPAIVLGRACGEAGVDGGTSSPVIERVRIHDPMTELREDRDNLKQHAATVGAERDALLGHVSNVESELGDFRRHAATLEQDLRKIRSNWVYRALCKTRDLFVKPKS